MNLIISKTADETIEKVATWIVSIVRDTLEEQERFTICLSGGSTPKKLYQLLAADEFKGQVDWKKIHVFWGDERYVPFDDNSNNARMAFDALLRHVPIPLAQIHKMRTDISPEASAKEYNDILQQYFNQAVHQSLPTFDLVLLGLGDNAHTLSLFPNEAVVHERDNWVRAVFVKEVNMQRITLTAPVINLSRRIAFLVTGPEKAKAVHQVLDRPFNPDLYPGQLIKPVNGELSWFLDESAATQLQEE